MKLKKTDIETVRDMNRRRLLKLASAGALVSMVSIGSTSRPAQAKDRDPGDAVDNDPGDDRDIADGRYSDAPGDVYTNDADYSDND